MKKNEQEWGISTRQQEYALVVTKYLVKKKVTRFF